MRFESDARETFMLNPMEENRRLSVPSEIRKDPLTGRTSRICHFMKLEWKKPDFEKLVAGTEKDCPFCPEKIMKITPLFPEELIPEGRLIKDDMVLFPNLSPYDSLSSVAVMGGRHYISMTDIEPGRIAAAFRLAIDFFDRLDAAGHPEAVYHIINWITCRRPAAPSFTPTFRFFLRPSPPTCSAWN